MELRRWWLCATAAMAMAIAAVPPVGASIQGAPRIHDIRFLIDGSGSMQVNDPDNRRGAALRLMAGIMPEGQRSGVWVFDRQPVNTVPVADTDAAWRNAMSATSTTLPTTGVAAHLEDGIRAATRDWEVPDPRFERHLIVLFDGFIDVGASEQENAASRQRILQDVAATLAGAGITVHGIGLTPGVDGPLMRSLAAATNGRYEFAENAAMLERAFTRVLTNIVVPNAIPPDNNAILVDNTVRALTVLVFRKHKNDRTTLITAAGQTIEFDAVPDDVVWRREAGYDLITVPRPAPGVWKMTAGVDPENLVIADSPLAMTVTGFANRVGTQDTLVANVGLLNQGRLVRDKVLLDTASMTALHAVNGEPRGQWLLSDDGMNGDERAGDGVFTVKIARPLAVGEHVVTLVVNGVGFQRAQRRFVSVHALPVMATLSQDRTAPAGNYHVALVPYRGLIQPDSMKVTAAVTGAGGASVPVEMARVGAWLWQGVVAGGAERERQEVHLSIAGHGPGQEALSVDLEPLAFEGARVLTGEVFDARPRRAVEAPRARPATVRETVMEYVEFKDVGWLTVLWQVLLANLLAAGAGYVGLRYWKKFTRPVSGVRPAAAATTGEEQRAAG